LEGCIREKIVNNIKECVWLKTFLLLFGELQEEHTGQREFWTPLQNLL